MLQEKCCRDITDILQKTFAQSFLEEFASRLDVDVNKAEGGLPVNQTQPSAGEQPDADASAKDAGMPDAASLAAASNQVTSGGATGAAGSKLSLGSLAKLKMSTQKPIEVEDIKLKDKGYAAAERKVRIEDINSTSSHQDFLEAYNSTDDPNGQAKLIQQIATLTPQDIQMHKRQKQGQLRFGDVICLSFHHDIFNADINKKKEFDKAMASMHDFGGNKKKPQYNKAKTRSMDIPDDVYKGLLYSDGVTDRGFKIISKFNSAAQNAKNMFKQCLFRIEIQQDSSIIKKIDILKEALDKNQKDLQKYGETGKETNHQKMSELKLEHEKIFQQIKEQEIEKERQIENGKYEMKYRMGNKITYGTHIQLKHLFSDKYLTLNMNSMSQDYGCCEMFLSETNDYSIFTIEQPKQQSQVIGHVVNFNDFFFLRSAVTNTPFYAHVFQKPYDEFTDTASYQLNAGQDPTALKAKLFMSWEDKEMEKDYIQSGDVIRFRHIEVNGFLTTSQVVVDDLLPQFPDFLKGQLRRMNNNQKVEREKGGISRAGLTETEKQFLRQDAIFEYAIINDEYVKKLKEDIKESVYIEQDQNRLQFTNSCWEIQRVKQFNGGNISIDEIVRFKHVGTGKYLSISDDKLELEIKNSSQSINTLFILKSDMSNKTETKYEASLAEGEIDKSKLLQSGQRVMIMSYCHQKFLQLQRDVKDEDEFLFEHKVSQIDDLHANAEIKDSQFKLVNHQFQKKDKEIMKFQIEEISFEESMYSYWSSCIFDELLEFFCFLNVWAVSYVDLEETVERFYYKPKRAIDLSDDLFDKVQKVIFILNNLESRIKEVEKNQHKLNKCKSEFCEQGILDVLCHCCQIIYYKTTPPCMFQRPFQSNKQKSPASQIKDDEGNVESFTLDLHKLNIDEYVAQEIARDHLDIVVLKMFDIILELCRGHRINSEKVTKFQGMFYQHYQVNDLYFQLSNINPNFTAPNPHEFFKVIGKIFSRSQKYSIFMHYDRSANSIVEFNKPIKNQVDGISREKIINNQIKLKELQNGGQAMLGINSKIAQENIERSNALNLVHKWMDLIEPVKFVDEKNQNLEKQIMIMNVISMHCRDKQGNGIYPYQMQVIHNMYERDENSPIKFGKAKVGNALRPFIYFNREKKVMSLDNFIADNPILGETNDHYNMQQKNQNQYEIIFDMHELTKNYGKQGKNTEPYVDYICAVLNMYAHICIGGNASAIKKLQEIGLDEGHILLVTHMDNPTLRIHEKFKQMYMFLVRVMYIKNDPISAGISNKNRCYVWERLKPQSKEEFDKKNSQFNIDDEDGTMKIDNDFYAGLAQKRITQMDDPNNSMIVLKHEQESKDLQLIRLIKADIVWFLKEGPDGTDSFFYHHSKRKFPPHLLKLKIKSLKVYLDAILALIEEDCVDKVFIEEIKLICQCALMGSIHLSSEQEEKIPFIIKSNWVYILMWIAKEIHLSGTSNRSIDNAIKAIECKILTIFETTSSFRLNLQVHQFLKFFREFQETNLESIAVNPTDKTILIEEKFQQLFKDNQLDSQATCLDKNFERRKHDLLQHVKRCNVPDEQSCVAKKVIDEINNGQEQKQYIPFDMIFMTYIFQNDTNEDVRRLALQIFIKNFNQRDILVKELVRTDIIVSQQDHNQYLAFLLKQRQVNQLTNKLVNDEMEHMIYKKSPSSETRNTKIDLTNILDGMKFDLQGQQPVQLRKMQNMIRHINLIDEVINVLLKRLIFKEFYYKDLFQSAIDFLFQCCFNNPSCQKYLLKDLNFFLKLMDSRIETGQLISEIIKCNSNENYKKNFAKFLIKKIVKEGYYKSLFFIQLTKLAAHHQIATEDQDEKDNQNLLEKDDSQLQETSLQQYILKQIIDDQRFRSLVFMKREFTQRKLGIIKTYAKKKEQYNISKKVEDAAILGDKENLDLHISVVDLIAACARNSPFGIAQAQKLIECEELLDSILSDSIPYLVKKHYFSLLFEVYLRKVPGLDDSHRLSVNDIKFAQILRWVIFYDLDHCYNFYNGLVILNTPTDTPEQQRKLRQVNKEIERTSEKEYDDKNYGKTEKDKEDENKFKAQLSSFKDTQVFYFLDTEDKAEFWKYLYEYNITDRNEDGILLFIANFYKDYKTNELMDESVCEQTIRIRERLLQIANQLYAFIDLHGVYIREEVSDLLNHISQAVNKIPHSRAFKVGKKRIITAEGNMKEIEQDKLDEQDESLNIDESRDVDNRMCGDKIMRELRDKIIKDSLHIKDALGVSFISSDTMISREDLKNAIKKLCTPKITYDEIMKAIDHFHQVSLDKKQEKNVMNVEPGMQGYVQNIVESKVNVDDEIKTGMINFKDIELQLKDVLKKAGYKAPNQQRDRGGAENELLESVAVAQIDDHELSFAINMDLKLFTLRFFEFIHVTRTYSEIHDFVHKLLKDSYISSVDEKTQLIKNLMNGFMGLQGDDDELVVIQIFNLILQNKVCEDDNIDPNMNTFKKKRIQNKNQKLKQELREWQDVMFAAGVPEQMITFIGVNNNPFLANKALCLLNSILITSSGENQQKMLNLLKKNNNFFDVFFYVKQRLHISKDYLLKKIKKGALKKFVAYEKSEEEKRLRRMKLKIPDEKIQENDMKTQKLYMGRKYDLELKYDEMKQNWMEDELNDLLKFMNSLCENCFEEAQIFLKEQMVDDDIDFKCKNRGKISSIDLIYEVVSTFIEIIDKLHDYVFSDFRTFKLIPLMMDTMIEFMYGPCLKVQAFLGGWKKLISTINGLMDQKEMGNYSGIHQEAKAQLAVLFSCSQLLLAIVDIKDPAVAITTHNIILDNMDIPNLIDKMVDIFVYKIGGNKAKLEIYQFNHMCNHYEQPVGSGEYNCIKNEFCEKQYYIPRDIATIQTGFNIYQILKILEQMQPNHPKLKPFRDYKEQIPIVLKSENDLKPHIFKQLERNSVQTQKIYSRFNKAEEKLLHILINESFPDHYQKYLNDLCYRQKEEGVKLSPLLIQAMNDAKNSRNQLDSHQILEKIELELIQQIQLEADRIEGISEEMDTQEDELTSLLGGENAQSNPQGFGEKIKTAVFGKKAKVHDQALEKSYKEMQPDERKAKTEYNRIKFTKLLKIYKQYIACNFYEDNIGSVEVVDKKEQVITTMFKIPNFVHCLTDKSRDAIPELLNKVSQKEKLEKFVSVIEMLKIEMDAQQELGRRSKALKVFANSNMLLSKVNFSMICLINALLMSWMDKVSVAGEVKISVAWQNYFLQGLGLVQTVIAGIVMVSYYLEYRYKFKYIIMMNENQNQTNTQYGQNKGSSGYGERKSGKLNIMKTQNAAMETIGMISQKSIFVQAIYFTVKELVRVGWSMYYDGIMRRNVLYFIGSSMSNSDKYQIVNALLLLDIVTKVQNLGNILYIIQIQWQNLISTFSFLVIVVYIFAFLAFESFSAEYQAASGPDDPAPPPYNMYCDTLLNCLVTTLNYGMRAGGGIGDVIEQPLITAKDYTQRYFFDFLFFICVNIVLLNILFGIIIDSFADKRAQDAEIKAEVQDMCFICGITKSTFEVEGKPWHEHIYSHHNLHSYLAFIIYVEGKPKSECSGMEKRVKDCRERGSIDFFPINRCAAIRNGAKQGE